MGTIGVSVFAFAKGDDATLGHVLSLDRLIAAKSANVYGFWKDEFFSGRWTGFRPCFGFLSIGTQYASQREQGSKSRKAVHRENIGSRLPAGVKSATGNGW